MRLAIVLFACVTLLGSTLPRGFADEEFPVKTRKVVKTDREWAKQLTRAQYLVTRQKATEPAFSGKLVNNHAKGIYECVCCDAELFPSRTKFNSGTGWPSFWQPISAKAIDSAADYREAEERIEVLCSTCGAHLGHVFTDGPPPTGLRYCINSVSLKFVRANAKAATSPAASKSTSKEKTPPAEDAKKDETEKKDAETGK